VKLGGAGSGSYNSLDGTTEAYVVDSNAGGSGVGIDVGGHLALSATDTSDIVAGAGAVAIAGKWGGAGLAGSVGVSNTENEITTVIHAFIDHSTVEAGSVSVVSGETASIKADAVGGSIAAGLGGTGASLAIAATMATNTISVEVLAYVSSSTVTTTGTGGVVLTATQGSTITAYCVSASISVSTGGEVNLALSGGGAGAKNSITGKTNAFIQDSAVTSGGDVSLTATSTPTIEATVAAVAISVASGGVLSGSLAIGASLATNTIGTLHDDDTTTPFEVRAYVTDSSISAKGDLAQTASSTAKITAGVGAGSAAISGGGVGVGLAGAGTSAKNFIATKIEASIDGVAPSVAVSPTRGITAADVILTATDESHITVINAAASLAAAVGNVGVAVAIGVALAATRFATR